MEGEAEVLQVRGAPVAVRHRGTGPALVYLHDEFIELQTPLLDHLQSAFHVLAPDLPGYGDSPRPDWLDDVDDMGYLLADLLETLGQGAPLPVVGAGLGGWLALEAAVRSPQLVDRLVLIGAPGPELDGHAAADYFVLPPEDRRRLLVEDPACYPDPDGDRQIRGEIMTGRLVWQPRYRSPKLARRLHRVRVPALVVWGTNDRFLPCAFGEALAAALPSARLEVVEGTGHLPGLERPDRTAGLITAFLAEGGRRE
jgi:pimeloyl-ACP methyl ester carboxylesterase